MLCHVAAFHLIVRIPDHPHLRPPGTVKLPLISLTQGSDEEVSLTVTNNGAVIASPSA